MDAVGGDQDLAVVGTGGLAARSVDEVGADAVRRFRPAGQMMAGENVLRAETLDRGVEQDLLQRDTPFRLTAS